jgi:protein arginine kinase
VRAQGETRASEIWVSEAAADEIAISSRVRLARNLRGHPFPGWADIGARRAVCEALCRALADIPCLTHPRVISMESIEEVDRSVLLERHVISRELVERHEGSALVLAEDEGIAVMVNEEDHLRLQAISPGMDLQSAWERVDGLDTLLERRVPYAFSHTLGYLTACPSNVGTALRASVMLHLSGLKLTNDLDGVLNGVEKLGYAVRGIMGEGTDANGNLFQISNHGTLGQSEQNILKGLSALVAEVATHERNARARLMEDRCNDVMDHVGRAYGTLLHARVLPSSEAIELLCALRLGVELGLVRNMTAGRVHELLLLTQPGHLQKMAGGTLDPETRDVVRATMLRKRVRIATLNG